MLLMLAGVACAGVGQPFPVEQGAAPAPPPVADRETLPRVLLIGDSISQGYTPPVRKLLAGRANVHQVGGGSTRAGLERCQEWLDGQQWDVVHFNFGLHDLKHWRDGQMDPSAPKVTDVGQYEENLAELVARLKTSGTRLVWASTTPVPEGANGRVAGDEIIYNAAALRVMEKNGVPVNDLQSVFDPCQKHAERIPEKTAHPEGPEHAERVPPLHLRDRTRMRFPQHELFFPRH